jgi:hypothetical protein
VKLAVPLTVLAAVVAVLVAACSSSKPEGSASAEQAGLRLIEALIAGNTGEARRLTEPDRREDELSAAAFGVTLPAARTKAHLENGSARANYEEDKAYASVRVTGRAGDRAIDATVFTLEVDGRWYATTAANPYWRNVKKQADEREAATRDPVTAAFEAALDADPTLPGEYFKPHPGPDGAPCSSRACATSMDDRNHLPLGISLPICSSAQVAEGRVNQPLCYTSNPPTSGPHANQAAPFGVLRAPASKEALVHSMEHGGVVVWYNTDNLGLVRQLEALVTAELARQRLVVLSQYSDLEPETIALTAWTRLLKLPAAEFTAEKAQTFIARHSRRFNPEGF